jgi:hypothetical protein
VVLERNHGIDKKKPAGEYAGAFGNGVPRSGVSVKRDGFDRKEI